MTAAAERSPSIRSLIPARIDRLPWSRFHTRMVVALGVAWVLDGLEVSVASNLTGKLGEPTNQGGLAMSVSAVSNLGGIYLLGEVIGALGFGRLSDKIGRRRLFMLTLGVYLIGSGLSAFTFGHGPGWVAYLYLTRIIAGSGIGGETAAINSAIDEMIPARFRGRVDIAVNGSYWGGSFIASLGTLFLLNHFTGTTGWRTAFLIGPFLGLFILYVRRNLPESPRWLIMHGRAAEAEENIRTIEELTARTTGPLPEVDTSKELEIRPSAEHTGYIALARTLFATYPRRSVLGAVLMITQSFLYNAIFFTFAIILVKFYRVNANNVGYYLMAFAAGNLIGALVLGRLFDTVGRRKMISGTYLLSGILLIISGELFRDGTLNAAGLTVAWAVVFFFASAGASAGYLTVSEVFPLEVRAQAIAVFYAIAQGFGILGPSIFGRLIGSGSRDAVFGGLLLGAGMMIIGGLVAAFFGVNAERKSLEDVATPLSVISKGEPAPATT